MEIERLDEATEILHLAISEFPIGANTLDDFKPIEEKISDLRTSLKVMNVLQMNLKILIHSDVLSTSSNIERCYEKFNENATNYLINTKALRLSCNSKAIQDIIYRKAGSIEIQDKVKSCLRKLQIANDKLTSMREKRKELMKKQYQLKLDCHNEIYDYQNFLKEQEAKKKQQLQEISPETIKNKERIDKIIRKLNITKKLITNLIAPMCHELYENDELIKMLSDHKDIIHLETIIDLSKNASVES